MAGHELVAGAVVAENDRLQQAVLPNALGKLFDPGQVAPWVPRRRVDGGQGNLLDEPVLNGSPPPRSCCDRVERDR